MSASFPYDHDKATEVVLWFLDKHGGSMSKLQLVKLVFLADREHLVRYGRPIVGGSYVAMQHGPVASCFLDDLKVTGESGEAYCLQGRDIVSRRSFEEDPLSESDLEILDSVNAEYGAIDAWRLREMTHRLEAWKKNYPDESENTSRPLPYEDFFLDVKGEEEMLESIKEEQEAWAELE